MESLEQERGPKRTAGRAEGPPRQEALNRAVGRLSARAQEALSLARTEATRLGHGYVGTEHLIVALAEQPASAAANVLSALGFAADDLRETMDFILGAPAEPAPDIAEAPLSPRLQRVVVAAGAEADRQNQPDITTLHLLVGLVRERAGIAVALLHAPGVGLERIGAEIQRATRDHASD